MEEVGKAWVLICCVIRSANLADRLNLLFSMSETGLPTPNRKSAYLYETRQYRHTYKQGIAQPLTGCRSSIPEQNIQTSHSLFSTDMDR